jgi:four helix bundle protein
VIGIATVIEFSFEKLQVYQEARAFRRRIYKLSRLLPRDEYKLKIQMRDAARSLTNCISEGHGRFTFKDRTHYFHESRGSLQELVDDISICNDECYAKAEHLETLRVDAAALLKRINGYLRFLKNKAEEAAQQRKKKKKPHSDDSTH